MSFTWSVGFSLHIFGAAAVGAMKKIATYETELTDAQWEFLQPMLPKLKKRGRPPTDRRCVLNAILYVLKGGIPWRLLPNDYPSWKTIYHIFRAWSVDN